MPPRPHHGATGRCLRTRGSVPPFLPPVPGGASTARSQRRRSASGATQARTPGVTIRAAGAPYSVSGHCNGEGGLMPDRWINPHGWGPQQPGQRPAPPQPGWAQPPPHETPTQPGWGSLPEGPPDGWGPPPPTPPQGPGGGVRSFLRRQPLAFFGGILLVLVLLGAVFGGTDDRTDPTSQAATAITSTDTLPTVARTEANSSTSPPTTAATSRSPSWSA